MHRNLAIGLGLVLVLIVADYCEAGPFGRNRTRRFRQRTFVTIPADTIVTTSEQPSEIQQADAIESSQEETQISEGNSGTWVRQRSFRGRRGYRGRRQRFVWIEQSQPTQTERTIISADAQGGSGVQQATAIEPIENEETIITTEIIREPFRETRIQRRRFGRSRTIVRRNYWRN